MIKENWLNDELFCDDKKKPPSENQKVALKYWVYFTYACFLPKSITIGVEIHNEEYVPITRPINNAKINPRILSPPKMKTTSNTKNTVNEVKIVRLNVLFKAKLIKVLRSSPYKSSYHLS